MTDTTLKNLSLEELEAQQKKLESCIEKKVEMKRKQALEQIKEIAVDAGLSFDEIVEAVRTATKRRKAPPIYRNPENPRQTWSGKGDAPAWFVTAKDPEALRIPGA